jgi:hypothetical protein
VLPYCPESTRVIAVNAHDVIDGPAVNRQRRGNKPNPSNLYMPWETDDPKPSEFCTTENMPAGTEPSCVRHDVCMYWVR